MPVSSAKLDQCFLIASLTAQPPSEAEYASAGPPGACRFGGSWVSQGTSGRCGGGWDGSSGAAGWI